MAKEVSRKTSFVMISRWISVKVLVDIPGPIRRSIQVQFTRGLEKRFLSSVGFWFLIHDDLHPCIRLEVHGLARVEYGSVKGGVYGSRHGGTLCNRDGWVVTGMTAMVTEKKWLINAL